MLTIICLCSDFSVLNGLILPVTTLFCHFVVFTTTGEPALPLNWIHSKIISAATFRMIGLTKNEKIDFLTLDWIYCSIRIMTVIMGTSTVQLTSGLASYPGHMGLFPPPTWPGYTRLLLVIVQQVSA